MTVKKIAVFPTQAQVQTLKSWVGLQRWVYNRCVEKHKENQKNKIKTTLKDLRTDIINNKNFEEENKWVLDYAYDLRDEAIQDFMKNLNSNLAKGGQFDIQFRSLKKQKLDGFSLSVLKKKWNLSRGFYSELFNSKNLKGHQKLPKKLPCDSRLVKTPTKKYFISIPEKGDSQARSNLTELNQESMIFIDPGIKNFAVGYDPSGFLVTWGKRDVSKIARLLHHKRKLQSKMTKVKSKKKKRSMRLALLRLGKKIYHLVTELHKKLAKFLCITYKTIFLPRLNFHNFKKLNRKSRSLMASYRHCEFLDKLKDKAENYGCRVIEVNEAYTSKTCSQCGFIKYNLKNADVYNCDRCSFVIGRDANASKNIMLRYLTKLELASASIEA